MSIKLYVGNLSRDTTANDLFGVFNRTGLVMEAHIENDERTGTSKGFGYVMMSGPESAEAAIAALNGKMLRDMQMVVKEA